MLSAGCYTASLLFIHIGVFSHVGFFTAVNQVFMWCCFLAAFVFFASPPSSCRDFRRSSFLMFHVRVIVISHGHVFFACHGILFVALHSCFHRSQSGIEFSVLGACSCLAILSPCYISLDAVCL